jgi:hypothetical protein
VSSIHAVRVTAVAQREWVRALLNRPDEGNSDHVIVYLQSTTAENVEAARRDLDALVVGWGYELAVAASAARVTSVDAHARRRGGDEVIDPVSVTVLVLSIPSAALAVGDPADRGRVRSRAVELIACANHLADQQVTVYLVCEDRPIDLTAADPDQLLDLGADQTDPRRPGDPSTPTIQP